MPFPTLVVKDGNAATQTVNTLPSAGQTTSANSLPVVIASDQRVAVDEVVNAASTDRSGTIAAGGLAQVLMPANNARRGFAIQNQSTGDLWINTLGTATASQPSLKVAAGVYYETPPSHAPSGAISVFGATTAQSFYAREW